MNHRSKNFYLSIIDSIKQDSKLPNLGISKQAMNYYVRNLLQSGNIKKVGYGTWEVLEVNNSKIEVKRSKKIATTYSDSFISAKPDSVRAHAFMFHLKIPKLKNWNRREEYLNKKGIKYKTLNNIGKGQKITIRGFNIHLKNNSIIFYTKESYISKLAGHAKSTALYDFHSTIRTLENILNASFQIRKKYVFKVCKEHYALIKNCLARQYDKPGKRKLYVYDMKGLWFLIDNSYKLHEAETIRTGEAVDDNEGIQEYFNSHKRTNFKATPEFILERIEELIEDRKYHAENMRTHVEAIKALYTGVNELRQEIKRFTEQNHKV